MSTDFLNMVLKVGGAAPLSREARLRSTATYHDPGVTYAVGHTLQVRDKGAPRTIGAWGDLDTVINSLGDQFAGGMRTAAGRTLWYDVGDIVLNAIQGALAPDRDSLPSEWVAVATRSPVYDDLWTTRFTMTAGPYSAVTSHRSSLFAPGSQAMRIVVTRELRPRGFGFVVSRALDLVFGDSAEPAALPGTIPTTSGPDGARAALLIKGDGPRTIKAVRAFFSAVGAKNPDVNVTPLDLGVELELPVTWTTAEGRW